MHNKIMTIDDIKKIMYPIMKNNFDVIGQDVVDIVQEALYQNERETALEVLLNQLGEYDVQLSDDARAGLRSIAKHLNMLDHPVGKDLYW